MPEPTTLNDQMRAVTDAQFFYRSRLAKWRERIDKTNDPDDARSYEHLKKVTDDLGAAYETLRCLFVATEADAALRARMVVAPREAEDDDHPA